MKASVAFAFLAMTASVCPAAVFSVDLFGRAGVGLLAGNETGAVAGAPPGSGGEILGGITFDDVSKLLTVNVGWGSATNGAFTDLTGAAVAGHIHIAPNPADPFNTAAGVTIDFSGNPNFVFNTSASNGSVIGAQALTPAQETAFNQRTLYINIHTQTNPNGEIRGNLIPEPSSFVALGLAGLGFGLRRRRV